MRKKATLWRNQTKTLHCGVVFDLKHALKPEFRNYPTMHHINVKISYIVGKSNENLALWGSVDLKLALKPEFRNYPTMHHINVKISYIVG